MTRRLLYMVMFVGFTAAPVLAFDSAFDSGSDGSDEAFSPLASIEIDLSLATTASLDTDSPVAGRGVYDAEKWAVVFKYTTIDIPAGVTVTFANHPSGAPVIWLASGDVTIDGIVLLRGPDGVDSFPLVFGDFAPGGFAGGRQGATFPLPTNGLGPGGGDQSSTGFAGGG